MLFFQYWIILCVKSKVFIDPMWFQIQNQQVTLSIIAKPNAKKTALLAITDQGLQISLHAKPHQGAANKELILFLSEVFAVPKSQIILKRGENSKYKHVTLPLTSTLKKFVADPEPFMQGGNK